MFASDPIAHLRSAHTALDHVVGVVDDAGPGVRGTPTPCDGWSVDDLLGHLRDGAWWVVGRLDGASPEEGTDVAASLRAAGAALVDGFGREGVLDGTVRLPVGEVPGMIALHLRATEAIVHAWDLAVATGAPVPIDDAEVDVALAFSEAALAMIPPAESPFAPSVEAPDDAPALARLVALLGRDPAWSAAPTAAAV